MVSPGEWILVPLTGDDPRPAAMEVGPVPRKTCFLERDENGGALAAMRCPELAPGRYPVKVWAQGQTIETAIQISG
jgi:hypothetical protein